MEPSEIQIKTTGPVKVALIEGEGKIPDFNQDVDRLYGHLYKNGLQDKIAGPLIGLFYTEFGGKCIIAIPIKEDIPVKKPVKIDTLPLIRCMSIIHKGGWKTIDESYSKLKEYAKANHLEWHFPTREIFIKTEGNEKDYLTEIQIPIEKD